MSLTYSGDFSFTSANSYGINGTDGSYTNEVVATIARTGDTTTHSGSDDVVTVPVSISSSNAVNGADYSANSTIYVTFPAGVNSENVTIPIYQNPNVAPTKSINLKLGTPISSSFFPATSGQNSTDITQTTYSIVNTASAYANNQSITIPSNGSANLYPDNIYVSNTSGQITNVQVTLIGVSQVWTNDLEVLLVGPNGKAVELLAGIGGSNSANGDVLTFSGTAPSALPVSAAITSGNYLPSVNQNSSRSHDQFNSPAPGTNPNTGTYSTNLGDFNGIPANGTWSLYIVDRNNIQGGNIAHGYQLQFEGVTPTVTSAPTPPVATPPVTSAPTPPATPTSPATPPVATPATTATQPESPIRVSSPAVDDTPTGTTETFYVTAPKNATVIYYTTDNTAHNGSDYIGTYGSLNLTANQTIPVTVTIPGSTASGYSTNYTLNVYNPSTGFSSEGVGTINYDSPIQVSSPSVTDTSAGTTETFTVTNNSSSFSNLIYYTSDGGAKGNVDYTGTYGNLALTPGESSQVTVQITGSTGAGYSKSYYLNVYNPNTGVAVQGAGTIDYAGIDVPPILSVSNSINTGTTEEFNVNLSVPYDQPLKINYYTTNQDANGNNDGSAQDGVDYTGTYGTFYFQPGQTSERISVPTLPNGSGDFYLHALDINTAGNVLQNVAGRGII